MIIHIFNDQKKFSMGYFKWLAENGEDFSDTILYHYGAQTDFFNNLGIKTRFISSWFNPRGHFKMYRDLVKAERIIVHSLASPYLLMFLFLNRKLCGKTRWIVWGKDLYIYHQAKRKTIPLKVYECFRIPVIRKLGYIITGFEEDYELAREWYGVTGKSIVCNMLYPNSVNFKMEELENEKTSEKLTVLLGNSGSKTNEHIEAITILKDYENNLLKVYCPLSYGGPRKYAEKVRAYGSKMLGECFVPLMNFIPLEEYEKIWAKVDVAVFNHKRQEALGNIYSLVLQGKTVYLSEDTSTFKFLNRIGVKIGVFRKNMDLTKQRREILESNRRILLSYINMDRNLKTWKKILHE